MIFNKWRRLSLKYFTQNLTVVIGLVLIWRGVWYVVDGLDYWLLNGEHIYSAVGGIIIGLIILFLPDGDLKEIQKL